MVNLPFNGPWLIRFLAITCVTSQLAPLVARADMEYAVDTTITSANPTGNPLQSDTVSGFITTDGTLGVILASDVLGWDLALVDGLNAGNSLDLTPANSTLVEDTGNALTATADGLSFNYSGSGEFLIQANSPGPFSGFSYFCFSTGGACLAGETIAPQDIFTDGVVATGTAAPLGTQPLNQSGTPEPSYALIVLVFLGVLVGVKRKFASITKERPASPLKKTAHP
jgi:hypothetical protein